MTCAGVSALTVMGGTAAFATDGTATLHNGGDANSDVQQAQDAQTAQLAGANTGANDALGITGNLNLGSQDCTTNLSGGNLSYVDDNNTAGNSGGDCTNDGTASNTGTANASVSSGDASATNSAGTTVSQSNSGGASVTNSANNNTVTGDDSPASLDNSGSASLSVGQQSSVGTWQGSHANSGHNSALAAVIGVNYGSQTGTTNVSGGNIDNSGDGNKAGNTGGNGSNTSNASNTGTASANITTGNASASNSSTTSVTQTNSGSASTTNTANGNTVSGD
ncbi:MAG: hypothetical protein ACXVJW_07325 [Acidimicrobiia bacterium]